jgi:methylthioribose-1-phosphate isomerase
MHSTNNSQQATTNPRRVSAGTPRVTFDQERDRVAEVCRALYRHDWMPGTAGNVSARAHDRVVISASGRAKGLMSRADTVEVSLSDGRSLDGPDRRPSAETAIHLAVYRSLPEVGAVVHAHAPYSTVLASVVGAGGQVRIAQWELAKGLGLPDLSGASIPVVANWPDVSRIARDLTTYLEDDSRMAPAVPALLISRHGVTTWGRHLTEATNRLECVEMLCRLVFLTRGEPAFEKEHEL